MGNGYSVEQMLDRILEDIGKVHDKIDKIKAEVSGINANGCAHRADDLRRIDELESWRTRGIVGVIGLAIGLVVEFILGATSK